MSKPSSDSRKNLKRPRGLLASRKNAEQGPSAKKPRSDDPQADLDPDTINTQDWSDVKELYENALDAFYGENPISSLQLVRGVLHECARLVSVHKDPTVIYSSLENTKDSKPTELASSFHTIYASAWYLMYHFARTDASVLTEDEPDEPAAYLLSALSACEEGQKALDSRKQERAWDLEFIWGRTLIGIAQSQTGENEGEGEDDETSLKSKISGAVGSDARSSLRKGIDRISYAVSHRPSEDKLQGEDEMKTQNERFARTLLFAGQDVLALAEYFEQKSNAAEHEAAPLDETYFESAQNLFSRVVNMFNLPEDVRVQGALGEAQVLLSMGAAIAERLEGDAEDGDIYEENLRKKAVESLKSAIDKFESIREQERSSQINDEIKPLFLEALVTLATLMSEGKEQEALYARYRAEGGVFDVDDEVEEVED